MPSLAAPDRALSVADGVSQLISLGIEVSQSLVELYSCYKSQIAAVLNTTEKLKELNATLEIVKKALDKRSFQSRERAWLKSIESAIKACEGPLRELQKLRRIFSHATADVPLVFVLISGRRPLYPLRETTLQWLCENLKDFQERLSPALGVLHVADATDCWTQIPGPDKFDGQYHGMSFCRPSPIYYASLMGLHEPLHQLLTGEDIDVNIQGGYYGSPLRAAAANGHEHVIELLLNSNAEIEAQGQRHGNALHLASARGHEHIIKLLLKYNANVRAQGGIWGDALQAASDGGHETICELLLDKLKEVDPQDEIYSDALQAALDDDCERDIEQLLRKPAAPFLDRYRFHHNPLPPTIRADHAKTFKLLFGKTAQSASSYNGSQISAGVPEPPYNLTDPMETYWRNGCIREI